MICQDENLPETKLSVVVPVYGSANTLPSLVDRLRAVLESIRIRYELIFVEDGGMDDTWRVLEDLATKHQDVVVAIQLMRNFGQHNAVMCGLRQALGEFIVTLDDDLQNPPEEIPKLLEAIESGGYDLVYGEYGSKKHEPWRNFGTFLVNRFYRIVFRSKVTVTSFRIMRRDLAQSILSYDLNFTFLDGLLAWNTQRIGSREVAHHPRKDGKSGYTLPRLITLAMNLFTNFSLLPLQIVSLFGFVASLGGFVLGLWYLFAYFFGRISVPGYASIIIAILILGGVQLLAIGIIGEYLGRLHLNVNRKPQYTVRRTIARISANVADDHEAKDAP
jgi:undecaprenyl-phosphate 4-deoxy-4-formamido-L-arabinose transferase